MDVHPSRETLEPGTRLGRYLVGRRLGGGGFGDVYEGTVERPSGPERVALKVLRRGGDDLVREARFAALLRHRNLVDVYEVGQADGRWYCAMELCPGGSLAQHAPLSPRAVVEAGLAICAALGYAHRELGLVHLDLKPENLLLAADGCVKVADLGLARQRGQLGRVVGTPAFMAPEQRQGGSVDGRTDVFGLGRTLDELAKGIGGGGAWTYFGEADEEADVDGLRHPPPPWLAEIVERCTEPDPDARFADVDALAAALRALPVEGPSIAELAGLGVAAQSDELEPPRRPLLAAVLAATRAPGLVILAGPVGVGKSTLAAAAADVYEGDPVRCGVRGLVDARSLAAAVAVELGGETRGDPRGHTLRVLSGRAPVLLVLDDADHLDPGAAELVGAWAEVAAVLVTARAALGVAGERVVVVPPLEPDDGAAMFRRLAADRGVALGASDPRVAEIVARLEGIPLALALAAGRLGVIGPDELAAQLSVRWLRGGGRVGQGSFAEALDDDWSLLSADEQETLAALSVFVGDFGDEELVAVVERPELVERLVQRSLVAPGRSPGRWRLSRVVAEHAEGRRQGDEAVRRHGRWFARAREPLDRPELLRAAHAAHPDLRIAVERALVAGDVAVAVVGVDRLLDLARLRGDATQLLPLVLEAAALAGLGRVERFRVTLVEASTRRLTGDAAGAESGYRSVWAALEAEGRWGGEAAEIDADDHECDVIAARVGLGLGALCISSHRREEAVRWIGAARDLARRLDHGRLALLADANAAWIDAELGDADAALAGYARVAAAAERLGDEPVQIRASSNLALSELRAGRLDEAEARFLAVLALAQATGDQATIGALTGNLGVVASTRGDSAAARGWFLAAERATRRSGQVVEAAWWRTNRAGELVHTRPELALRLLQDDPDLLAGAGELRGALSARTLRVRALSALGRVDDAREELVQAELLGARLGTWGDYRVATGRGAVASAAGDVAEARAQFRLAIAAAVSTRDRTAERGAWEALSESPGPWSEAERAEVEAGLARVLVARGAGGQNPV